MRRNKLISRSLILLCCMSLAAACGPSPGEMEKAGEPLEIYPDYTSVVIPPNIAPLNFLIENQGTGFIAVFENEQGGRIRVRSKQGNIQIPRRAWKRLLEKGRGGNLTITVLRKDHSDGWQEFSPVHNRIAGDNIDPYIAFRKIPPANIYWKNMGIYQRCVENFRVTPIMENSLTEENCMNCHSFNGGDPSQMLFHMRGAYGGTVIRNGEETLFVDTKSDHTRSAGVYPSWHPDGKLIAFSANMVRQGFHASMGKIDYVHDRYSDIVIYDVENNTVTRPAQLATGKLENVPAWSSDGRTLYYTCAEEGTDTLPYYRKQYNLMSIGFDPETRIFGTRDTLISWRDFGRSVTFPRERPSGGIISFIGADYGYFTIYNNEADVYFLRTDNGQITRPDINSTLTESYPSWSSGGSWLMFVSKRDDGIHSQVWFSHVDEDGSAGKPFVLPQKDPGFYRTYMYNYNRPEFITGKVDLTPRKVFALAKEGADTTRFNMAASISAATGATAAAEEKQSVFYHHD